MKHKLENILCCYMESWSRLQRLHSRQQVFRVASVHYLLVKMSGLCTWLASTYITMVCTYALCILYYVIQGRSSIILLFNRTNFVESGRWSFGRQYPLQTNSGICNVQLGIHMYFMFVHVYGMGSLYSTGVTQILLGVTWESKTTNIQVVPNISESSQEPWFWQRLP